MDWPGLDAAAQRVSASLGVAWAGAALRLARAYLRPAETLAACVAALAAAHAGALGPLPPAAQRLLLTVCTQLLLPAGAAGADPVLAWAHAAFVLLAAGTAADRVLCSESEALRTAAVFLFANAVPPLPRAPLPALALAALAVRAAPRAVRDLADGVGIFAFEQAWRALAVPSWPLPALVAAVFALEQADPALDPTVPRVQERARAQLAAELLAAARALPQPASVVLFVALHAATAAQGTPFRAAAAAALLLAFASSLLDDLAHLFLSISAGDQFGAFALACSAAGLLRLRA